MNATTTGQMVIIIRLRSCLTFVEWDSPEHPTKKLVRCFFILVIGTKQKRSGENGKQCREGKF